MRSRWALHGCAIGAVLAVVVVSACGSPPQSFTALTQPPADLGTVSDDLEERFGIDFSEARERAADRPGYDFVIDQSELDNWVEAQMAEPELLDGLTIEVMLDPKTPEEVAHLVARLEAAGRTDVLSEAEQLAVMSAGGDGAALLDRLLGEETAAPVGPTSPPAACVSMPDLVEALPETELALFFLCEGRGPFARVVTVEVEPGLDDAARITRALSLLGTLTRAQRGDGLYTLVEDPSALITSVEVTGGVATVDFTSALEAAGLSRGTIGVGLIEQVVNTVFTSSDVQELVLTVKGSCERFAFAVGGTMCHVNLRDELTNTERGDGS